MLIPGQFDDKKANVNCKELQQLLFYIDLGIVQLETYVNMKPDLYDVFQKLAKDYPQEAKVELIRYRELVQKVRGFNDR